MTVLPEVDDPLFAERMRQTVKSGLIDGEALLAILEDGGRTYPQRFAALYAILQELHRAEKHDEYTTLVRRYAPEFGREPYFHTFEAVVALGDGMSESGARRALGHCRKAVADFPDRPGVLHQYASISATLFDLAARVDHADAERALDAVERAIATTSADNPNFHRTRARLLRHVGRIEEALMEINTAIRQQDASTPSEIRRLAQFEALRTMLHFDRSSQLLSRRIEDAKRELDAAKSEQVQLLGVLAAVIALITSSIAISTAVESDKALRYIVTTSGAITMAFSALMWSGGASRWWRVLAGLAVGAAMTACGLLVEVEFR